MNYFRNTTSKLFELPQLTDIYKRGFSRKNAERSETASLSYNRITDNIEYGRERLNNKYMKDQYNPVKATTYIPYLDPKKPLWLGNNPRSANT